MCTPLAGRIDRGLAPSSRARSSSAQTPAALTTTPARTSIGRPVSRSVRTAPATRPLGPQQAGGLHPVDGHRPERGGGLGHGQGEAGVVDPGVVVEEPGGQAAPVEVGHELEGLPLRQPLVQLADPGAAGGVVHPQGGADPPGVGPGPGLAGHAGGEDRDEEGEGLDEVGGEAEQPLAFGQRLVDEAELLLLEVAQAAVDELGGARRRAGGEVAPLDEGRPQPPPGGVEGDAGAGDPAADDEQVEGLRAEALEVPAPAVGRRSSPEPDVSDRARVNGLRHSGHTSWRRSGIGPR